MDNQYNYYKPDEDGKNENQYQSAPKAPKPRRKVPKKVAAVAGAAVMFGVIGGLTFQGTNYVAGKVLGLTRKQNVETTKTVSNSQLTTSKTTVMSDVSEIVDNTIPSIVSITNMSVQQVQNFFGGVIEQPTESAGSGIIISQNDAELLIVSNNHVVEGNKTLTVTFSDGSSVEAKVKGTDAAHDLAIVAVPLKDISNETMKTVKIATLGDSDTLKVGEPAIAIGNALGYGQSVTDGIISATGRKISGFDGNYIQTNAAINPGNSGGALLNASGEVIGINSAKINSSAVEGMGFAIPISDASKILQNLMNKKTRSRVAESEQGQLGIRGYDVTEEGAQMYNMPRGVFVAELIEGSGAQKAGITKGSIITGFDGSSVNGMNSLQELLAYYRAGEKVEVTIQGPSENGEYKEEKVMVTLGKKS